MTHIQKFLSLFIGLQLLACGTPSDGNTSFVDETAEEEKAGGTWSKRSLLAGKQGFGQSLALSKDGKTAVYGLSQADDEAKTGLALVYRKTGSTWGRPFELRSDTALNYQYTEVAVSSDGKRVAVLAQIKGSYPKMSELFVFSREQTSSWTKQILEFPASASPISISRIAMASDNKTIAAAISNTNSKSVILFTPTSRGYTASVLSTDTGADRDHETRLSFSDDGKKIVSIGTNDKPFVTVFTRGSRGFDRGIVLKEPQVDISDISSLEISGNGKVIALGLLTVEENRDYHGDVYTYELKANGSWSAPTLLDASDREEKVKFACSLDLSFDGKIIAIGDSNIGPSDDGSFGSVELYTKKDQHSPYSFKKRIEDSDSEFHGFGFSLGLSGNGKTLAVVSNWFVDEEVYTVFE